MPPKSKITDKDLYEFLGILPDATEKEIRSAYRKKALQCHPDKNPDDPNAPAHFRELSEAFEVLICPTAKVAYDQVLKGRAAAKLRTRELDAKRRKLKEDLERREKAASEGAKKTVDADVPDELKLQREIERLRKEGSQTLLREQEFIRQEIINQQKNPQTSVFTSTSGHETILPRLRIRWKPPTSFDEKTLEVLCSKYGTVSTLVVLDKSALVEFLKQTEAEAFYDGESSNPDFSSFKWLSKGRASQNRADLSFSSPAPVTSSKPSQPVAVNPVPPSQSFEDFEAMVLKNLAAAAETQKRTASLVAKE